MESDENKGEKQVKDADKYAMDFGIVNISKLSSGTTRMRLPTTVSVDPCEGKIEEKLRKVLEFKTMGKSMVQLLRPVITDRSILTPQKFRLKIQQVCDLFAQTIENEGEDYLYKELFEDIISMLKNEEDKCELLDQYRHMLLMG
ncbi:MAG: hypothetical protein LBB18_00675 [Puniceicoccales bacterium]|jgi:hypothetical protein|nr:hypothetical protein [Puniceicoccales bacterium]